MLLYDGIIAVVLLDYIVERWDAFGEKKKKFQSDIIILKIGRTGKKK